MINKIHHSLNQVQLIFTISLIFLCIVVKAQSSYDSLNVKTPKHFFKTTLLIDAYSKPKQTIKDTDAISRRLKSYSLKQFNISFTTPIATINRFSADSTINDNTHYLLTANYMLLQPKFDGISNHNLTKIGIGFRLIHNTGKKGLFFADFSPFVTGDNTIKGTVYWRLASTLLYSHMFSERFNLRVGLTKSFLWGNRLYAPFIGFRIGKLDGVNLSVQFPRNISLQVPLSDAVRFSIYTKPQGGVFLFSNVDSIYFFKSDRQFYFTRYELLSGLRLDFIPSERFAFYVAAGISSRNNISLYSERANEKYKRLPLRKVFYEQKIGPTGFLNIGLVFKFGKSKAINKNTNLYEAIDLNNGIDGGDNNLISPNSEIRKANSKKNQLKLKDVQDLIDFNEY